MKNIFLSFIWFLLFVYSSFVYSSATQSDLHIALSKEIYQSKQEEAHLAYSVVRIFNKHTSANGTAFFISPDRVVTNFHAVCCFRGPVNENLFISVSHQPPVAVSNIVYLDPYNDLAVLKLDDFSSEYFLTLDKTDIIKEKEEIRAFGYVADYPDIIRLKGAMVEKGNYFDTGIVNFYAVDGMSGAPVLREGTDMVTGVISTSSYNVSLIVPVSRVNKLITGGEVCKDEELCQLAVVNELLTKANQSDPHAQFVLGGLLNKGFGSYLAYYAEELGQDIGINKFLWWYLASESEHVEALLNFGLVLIQRENQGDIEEGIQNIRKAAEKGNIPGNYIMGMLLQTVLSYEEDALNRSENHLIRAASVGHILAQFDLGKFYHKKYEESDTDEERGFYKEKALFWHGKAARENGYLPSAGEILKIISSTIKKE